ncbi:MAG TPA: fused MFS/spermidine synthase [Dermatophilaceae bacterium]|nr:fused MFS/spermidine synthase [Dermatophilaceae bacterium]
MSRRGAQPDGRFHFEPDDRGGVTVLVDGHPQSHVDLADPELLAFDYVAQLAMVLDVLPAGPLRVTHLGGAGLTLARWVAATRPGSPQIVLEPDAELTAAVRERLPLPRGHRIRIRPVDGRSGLAGLADGSADAVVLDAYAAGRVPGELVTVEALAEVGQVLAPAGVLVANLADEPGLGWVARVVASLESAGWAGDVGLVAAAEVLKGRRFGNVVVAAARTALDLAALRRRAASASWPTAVRDHGEVRRLACGARPFTDATAEPSPVPPDPGSWRVR